jgi:hypothetical protein
VPSNHRFDATFFSQHRICPLRQIDIISASVTSWAVVAALIDQPTNSLPRLNEATPRHQTFQNP